MMLFIDTSIFVDVLRKKPVSSSKYLFDSILEIAEIATRNVDHFDRIREIHALTPEDLGF